MATTENLCPACNRPLTEIRHCTDCGQAFQMRVDEVVWFVQTFGPGGVPARCNSCRKLRRAWREHVQRVEHGMDATTRHRPGGGGS